MQSDSAEGGCSIPRFSNSRLGWAIVTAGPECCNCPNESGRRPLSDSRVPAGHADRQLPILFPNHQIRRYQCRERRERSLYHGTNVAPRRRGLAYLQVSRSPNRQPWLAVGPNALPNSQLPYSSRLFHLLPTPSPG